MQTRMQRRRDHIQKSTTLVYFLEDSSRFRHDAYSHQLMYNFWSVVCQFVYGRRDKQSHLQTPLKHYPHCRHGWPANNKSSTVTVTACAVFQPQDHRKANPGNICCLSVKVCPWWLDSYTFGQRRQAYLSCTNSSCIRVSLCWSMEQTSTCMPINYGVRRWTDLRCNALYLISRLSNVRLPGWPCEQ